MVVNHADCRDDHLCAVIAMVGVHMVDDVRSFCEVFEEDSHRNSSQIPTTVTPASPGFSICLCSFHV